MPRNTWTNWSTRKHKSSSRISLKKSESSSEALKLRRELINTPRNQKRLRQNMNKRFAASQRTREINKICLSHKQQNRTQLRRLQNMKLDKNQLRSTSLHLRLRDSKSINLTKRLLRKFTSLSRLPSDLIIVARVAFVHEWNNTEYKLFIYLIINYSNSFRP